MNQRRKFILNSSMAAIALLTIDPISSFGRSLDSFSELSLNSGTSFTMVNTGKDFDNSNFQTIQRLSKLKARNSNLLLIDSVERSAQDISDISLSESGFEVKYRIINSGKVKIGIISSFEKNCSNDMVNNLAVLLKNEKKCDIVICLSQLGYKSDVDSNDLSLAASSSHIDIIVGDHYTNFCKQPVVTHNKNKEEVILNYTGKDGLALHSVEIGLDKTGRKNLIKFKKLT